MSGFLLSGCCCGAKPCVTHKDEFASYYNILRYQLADTPGGSTPISVDGWDSGASVSLDGEGSFTVDIAAPTAALEVGSLITSLGTGAAAGVTVRRADSADSISLWWLGGTSWELRQGSTVLESIAHAAGAFKLVLKTPLDPTTDVEVWIGGTLVHTESAVVFVAPSELWHVGLITDGESTFEYLETTPCPKIIDCEPPGGCLATVGAEVPPIVPVVWSMSVPAIGDAVDNPDCNLWGDDDFVLIRGENAVGYNYGVPKRWQQAIVTFDPLGSIIDNGDPDINGPICNWVAVIPDYNHRVFECAGEMPPTVPAGKLPVKWLSCAFGNDVDNHPTAAGTTGNTWLLGIQWRNVGTLLAPDMEFRVVLEMSSVVGTLADYIGAWVKYNAADVISGAFVLDHVSQSGCVMPATITVTAGGQDEIARRVLECWDVACTPPVTPQPGTCYVQSINLVDADDNPWHMTAVLWVQFDDTTGSWYWQGTASPHPLADPHPTCGEIIFATIKIHCVELEEGASKSWVLDLTYDGQTSRFPMVEDPEFGYGWEGTTDKICSGQTWDFFAGPLNSSESTWQFGSCEWDACADPHGYYFGAWLYTECDGGSGYTQHGGYLIFSPTTARPWMTAPVGTVYYSPVPSGYSGQVGGIYMYVESGTVRVQLVDVQLDPIPDGFASVGYSCDPNDGRPVIDDTSPISYLWGFPSPITSDPFGICGGTTGFGSWEVVFP